MTSSQMLYHTTLRGLESCQNVVAKILNVLFTSYARPEDSFQAGLHQPAGTGYEKPHINRMGSWERISIYSSQKGTWLLGSLHVKLRCSFPRKWVSVAVGSHNEGC